LAPSGKLGGIIPMSDENCVGRRESSGSAGILLECERLTTYLRRLGMYLFNIEYMSVLEQGLDFFDSKAANAGLAFYWDDFSHEKMYKITIL
jgi:hypothetical protein